MDSLMNPGVQQTFKDSIIINLNALIERLGILDYDCSIEFKNELLSYENDIPFPPNILNGIDIYSYISNELLKTPCKEDKIALLYSSIIMRHIYNTLALSTDNKIINPIGQYNVSISIENLDDITNIREESYIEDYINTILIDEDINSLNIDKTYNIQQTFFKKSVDIEYIFFSAIDQVTPGFFYPSINSINSIIPISSDLFKTYGTFITNLFINKYLTYKNDYSIYITQKINDRLIEFENALKNSLLRFDIISDERKLILPIYISDYINYYQSIDYIYKIFTDIIHRTIIYYSISISRQILYEIKNNIIIISPDYSSGIGGNIIPGTDETQKRDETPIRDETLQKDTTPTKNEDKSPEKKADNIITPTPKSNNNIIIISIILIIIIIGIIYFFIKK